MRKVKYISFLLIFSTTLFSQDWTQVGADIDGEASGDFSGYSVSLSENGNFVAIGAWGNDGNGTSSGHCRVFEYSGGVWGQVGADIDGETADNLAGWSVSLSSDGSVVAIGAPYNGGNGYRAGHVRVYEYSGGVWGQVGADIDGEATEDGFGHSVSLSSDGNRIAIGGIYNNGNGGDSGHARVYEYSGGGWVQVGADIDGEAAGDNCGRSVSLSSDGSRLAIGSPANDGNGSDAGHCRVFEYSGGGWSQIGSDIDGEAAGDNSGYSVSLSSDGTRVAIGAYGNDGNGGNAGHVRIYSESGGTWTRVGADIDGEAAGDNSGISVFLSSDGTRVAIGADRNDGNGSDAGHVRIFDWNGSSWIQVGTDIDGEAASDQSGNSVSLSSNGTRVAIGAYHSDGNGSDAGHTRIYDSTPGINLRLTEDSNDGTTYKVKVAINATSAMKLGTSSLRFNFNSLGLSNPTVGKVYQYDVTTAPLPNDYSAITVTEPTSGVASVNIVLTSPDDGHTVSITPVWTDICQVVFNIDNQAQSSGLTWRGVGEASNPTELMLDDNTTSLNNTGNQGTFSGTDDPLPVELTSFTVENTFDGVLSKWTTESEIENLGFLLERKTKDADWQAIASYKSDVELEGQGSTSSATNYEYLDALVEANTTYEYRLADVDYYGVVTYHSVRTVKVDKAPLSSELENFTVLPAYPNPFNPSTTLTYGLDTDSKVSIAIYDITGKLINTLINRQQKQGWHSVEWFGTDYNNNQVPAGIYLSKITSNNNTKTTKLMLLK